MNITVVIACCLLLSAACSLPLYSAGEYTPCAAALSRVRLRAHTMPDATAWLLKGRAGRLAQIASTADSFVRHASVLCRTDTAGHNLQHVSMMHRPKFDPGEHAFHFGY